MMEVEKVENPQTEKDILRESAINLESEMVARDAINTMFSSVSRQLAQRTGDSYSSFGLSIKSLEEKRNWEQNMKQVLREEFERMMKGI